MSYVSVGAAVGVSGNVAAAAEAYRKRVAAATLAAEAAPGFEGPPRDAMPDAVREIFTAASLNKDPRTATVAKPKATSARIMFNQKTMQRADIQQAARMAEADAAARITGAEPGVFSAGAGGLLSGKMPLIIGGVAVAGLALFLLTRKRGA